MKRSCFPINSSIILFALALLTASCAGGPAKAPDTKNPPPVPEKVRKERLVTVKVPVLVKETSFYADGLVDEYTVYKYDAGLKLLLETGVYDGSRPDPVERMLTELASGRVKAELSYDAEGKVKLRREYGFDSQGRVVEERVLDGKANLQSSSTYAYDASGNRVEWMAFDGKAVLKAQTRYTYTKGLSTLIEMSDGLGHLTGTIVSEYDGAGLLQKRSYKAADGSLLKFEVSVWTSGRLAALELRRADSSLVTKTVYTYGELGQVLSELTTDGSDKVKDRKVFDYSVREDQKTEVYWE